MTRIRQQKEKTVEDAPCPFVSRSDCVERLSAEVLKIERRRDGSESVMKHETTAWPFCNLPSGKRKIRSKRSQSKGRNV